MKIAICSLSQLSHVTHFIDAAQRLKEKNEVCYFLGFYCQDTINFLQNRQIPYQVILNKQVDIQSVLIDPATVKSTYDLFENYFFKHATLILPSLIEALKAWKPDLIVSYLRDYAGMTAADILDIPMVSFGLSSPVRIEGIDPPFWTGASKDTPKRLLQFMWKFHNEFNKKIDLLYNQTIRRVYGLNDVYEVSTLHSTELILVCSIPMLSNKYSPEPSYVKYVGPLFSRNTSLAKVDETDKIAHIASSPKPRVFVSLGTIHVEPLIEKCLKALVGTFPGTIIVSLGGKSINISSLLQSKNIIWSSFFFDVNKVLNLVDVVVTVGNKTVLESLAAAKPLVCLPRQGEQYELAYQLQSIGVAEVPCPRCWDTQKFAIVTEQVATEDRYQKVASVLQAHIKQSGGADEVVRLFDTLELNQEKKTNGAI